MRQCKPLNLCITGPTATGKTEIAVELCKAIGGEVISMDSMQIYQKLFIGTAMPTIEEMGSIPHHMLSIVPPDGIFTVYDYQQQACDIMHQIQQRGKIPVFCGGTGLYLHAITHPISFASAGTDETIRNQLEWESDQPNGRNILYERLVKIDLETAKRLHPNNTRRVIRALEVFESTGKPISVQNNDWNTASTEDYQVIALNWPRQILYERINLRVDRMIQAGLIDEVKRILCDVPRESQSMQAIGYREIIAMLMGECTREEAIALIKRNTRRYAKRQLTWLRRDQSIQWIQRDEFADTQSIVDWIVNKLHSMGVISGEQHD